MHVSLKAKNLSRAKSVKDVMTKENGEILGMRETQFAMVGFEDGEKR